MRNRAPLDLRTDSLGDVLAAAGHRLGTVLDPTIVLGEDGATAGTRTYRSTWVRLQHRQAEDDDDPAWVAEETAHELAGVRKPRWHRAVTWNDPDRGVRWRADELDCVTTPVLGDVTGLFARPQLSAAWWTQLRTSLAALAAAPDAGRTALSQATVTRRITSVFGQAVDTTITEWVTAHGDVHWGNLTGDGHLLDWEVWGRGPRGLDAANLWGMALPYPDLAARVQHEFADELNSRSGLLVQLMWCGTALRATARRDDLAAYRAPVRAAADALLDTLLRRG